MTRAPQFRRQRCKPPVFETLPGSCCSVRRGGNRSARRYTAFILPCVYNLSPLPPFVRLVVRPTSCRPCDERCAGRWETVRRSGSSSGRREGPAVRSRPDSSRARGWRRSPTPQRCRRGMWRGLPARVPTIVDRPRPREIRACTRGGERGATRIAAGFPWGPTRAGAAVEPSRGPRRRQLRCAGPTKGKGGRPDDGRPPAAVACGRGGNPPRGFPRGSWARGRPARPRGRRETAGFPTAPAAPAASTGPHPAACTPRVGPRSPGGPPASPRMPRDAVAPRANARQPRRHRLPWSRIAGPP